jgi:outer membrane protein OmpA-like peptidoglycan-associated protein
VGKTTDMLILFFFPDATFFLKAQAFSCPMTSRKRIISQKPNVRIENFLSRRLAPEYMGSVQTNKFILASHLLCGIVLHCATPPKPKVQEPPRAVTRAPVFDAQAANEELAKVTILGFRQFTDGMAHSKFDAYGDQAAIVAKKVLETMPADYKLQIVGHARQYPSMRREYVKSLSTMRAKYVYHYMSKKGLPESKMEYIGVGDDEPDADQERNSGGSVSFRVSPVNK